MESTVSKKIKDLNKKVLILEDNPLVLDFLISQLIEEKIQVEIASGWEEALNKIKNEMPVLFVADFNQEE